MHASAALPLRRPSLLSPRESEIIPRPARPLNGESRMPPYPRPWPFTARHEHFFYAFTRLPSGQRNEDCFSSTFEKALNLILLDKFGT
jgi:hypothetical protein